MCYNYLSFYINEFRNICESKKKFIPMWGVIQKPKTCRHISLLYGGELIGNTGQKVRIFFRGDDELVLKVIWKFMIYFGIIYLSDHENNL